jgi:hypothetical protein
MMIQASALDPESAGKNARAAPKIQASEQAGLSSRFCLPRIANRGQFCDNQGLDSPVFRSGRSSEFFGAFA